MSISERYSVDATVQDQKEDCYLSMLHISDVDLHDSRPYYLVVDNERGIDRHAINLIVEGMFTGANQIPNLIYSSNLYINFIVFFFVDVEIMNTKSEARVSGGSCLEGKKSINRVPVYFIFTTKCSHHNHSYWIHKKSAN